MMNNRIHGSSTTSCGACSSSTNDDDESSSTGIFQNLHIYMRQPKGIAWGGIGLAFLYFNVLSFGGIMTTYLVSRGMSLKTIGLWRGISSAIGLLGTGVFDCSLRQNWKLEQTGLASVVWQFVWLGVCLLSVVVDDGTSNSLALALLILGVLPSRIGLWVYDISVTQLMQQHVEENVRGRGVGGAQTSLNAFMSLFLYLLGLVYSSPNQFHVFVIGGYLAVGVAVVTYTFGLYLPFYYIRKKVDDSAGEFQLVPTTAVV
jgi:iron-regulated transporter 1